MQPIARFGYTAQKVARYLHDYCLHQIGIPELGDGCGFVIFSKTLNREKRKLPKEPCLETLWTALVLGFNHSKELG